MKTILTAFLLLVFIPVSSWSQPIEKEASTREAIMGFLSAFGEKDSNKIAACFSENIDWYIFESPYFPWTGRRTKRSELPGLFRTLFSYFVSGSEIFEISDFLVDGENAAIFARLGRTFKKTSGSFSMYVAIRFRVEDGRITTFYLYEQTPVLEKAFTKTN